MKTRLKANIRPAHSKPSGTEQRGASILRHNMRFPNEGDSHFFDSDSLRLLLSIADCEGIRFYYGIETTSKVIAVAIDADSNDMVSSEVIEGAIGFFSASGCRTLDKKTGALWTYNYRKSLGARFDFFGIFFDKAFINSLISTKDCVGIKLTYGLDEAGYRFLIPSAILVTGKEIYYDEGPGKTCPPCCSTWWEWILTFGFALNHDTPQGKVSVSEHKDYVNQQLY